MRHFTLFFGLLLISLPGFAHGPTPQKAVESITIHAPVAKVWLALKQFDAIANWHPDLKHSEGDDKNESGGKRTLTFQNNESLVEELDYYSDQEHEYSYCLLYTSPSPRDGLLSRMPSSA